jgi:CheY-like chemotaxis protein
MIINKILVVDDDYSIRVIAEISLAEVGGFTVLLADSPSQALSVLESETPDIILMDVKMPEMDGPTLLAKIREIPKLAKIPVVLMSASVTDDERRRFASLGAKEVIRKPFDAMTLPAELRAAVNDL